MPAHEPTLDAELRRVLGGDLRISSRIFFSDALGAGDYASWPFLYTLCHLFNKFTIFYIFRVSALRTEILALLRLTVFSGLCFL